MKLPTLCAETVDMIIDHLHDDKLSLAACGLSCRQWLPSTRYHLFGEFKLEVDKFTKALELLKHPLSTIPPVIRCLVICDLNSEPSGKERLEKQSEFIRLASSFSMIGSLRLSSNSKAANLKAVEMAWLLLSELDKVETLEFVDFFTSDFGLAADIIYQFPRLKSLLFEDFGLAQWKWASSDAVQKPGHGPSSVVIVVGLSHKTFALIASWISSLTSVPRIDLPTLTCQAHNPTPVCQFWRDIMCASATSVEHLRIDFNVPVSSNTGDIFDFAGCKNLRTMQLRNISLHPTRLPTHYLWAPRYLSQVTSGWVEEVKLQFSSVTDYTQWLNNFDWISVAEHLSRPQFANLRSLHIYSGVCLMDRSSALKAEKSIREGPLMDLNVRGIIEFEFHFLRR